MVSNDLKARLNAQSMRLDIPFDSVMAVHNFLDLRGLSQHTDISNAILQEAEREWGTAADAFRLLTSLSHHAAPCGGGAQVQASLPPAACAPGGASSQPSPGHAAVPAAQSNAQRNVSRNVTAIAVRVVATHRSVADWLSVDEHKLAFGAAVRLHMQDARKTTWGALPVAAAAAKQYQAFYGACERDLFPPDPKTEEYRSQEATSIQRVEVEYWRYTSGYDVLGTWAVAPLGHLIRYVFVQVQPLSGAPPSTLDDIAVQIDESAAPLEHAPRPASNAAELHKLKRFVYHYTKNQSLQVGYLDGKVVEDGIRKAGAKVRNDAMFASVRSLFVMMANHSMQPSRGLLLYGPPGTGKTDTSGMLGAGLGMTPVRDGGYAAGELTDGLQGGTEKKARTMLERAKACPWLMFCVVVDEIETLVPNRNDKSNAGGSGGSTLGVLLTYFGGMQNVENIFVFGATNLRGDIDAAFARRLTGKVFVGLPTSRSRAQWCPRRIVVDGGQEKKIPDRRFVFSGAVQRCLAALTTNMSGSQMNMVMAELQVAMHDAGLGETGPFPLTTEDIRSAVQTVAKREHILFGGVTVPALVMRTPPSEVEALLEAGIEENIANVLIHQMGEWTGRMLLNLSDLYEGSVDTFRGPYLDVERIDGSVWTFRQQHVCKDASSAGGGVSVSREFFERMLLQLGVALDMNCVKLIDNGFFLNQGFKDENDMVQAMQEEMLQCEEYARSLLILDLDAAFVDMNVDTDRPSAETIHRSVLFNNMLDMAKDKGRCQPSEERFQFVVVMTSRGCIASRVEQRLRWPYNVLRQYQLDEAKDEQELQQCQRCGELAAPADSERQAQCQRHDATALLSRDVSSGSANREAYEQKHRDEVKKMPAAQSAKWMWNCCGQSYHSTKCTALGAARKHEFAENPEPVRCTKKHSSLPSLAAQLKTGALLSSKLERVWCNACSQPVAEVPESGSEEACFRCTGTEGGGRGCVGSGSQTAPVWVHTRGGKCPACELQVALRAARNNLSAPRDEQHSLLWQSLVPSDSGWAAVDRDHATWLHERVTTFLANPGIYVKPIAVPWSPAYPVSAKMYLDLRVFIPTTSEQLEMIEFTTFDGTKKQTIEAAIDSAKQAGEKPNYTPPQPSLTSETFKLTIQQGCTSWWNRLKEFHSHKYAGATALRHCGTLS